MTGVEIYGTARDGRAVVSVRVDGRQVAQVERSGTTAAQAMAMALGAAALAVETACETDEAKGAVR